MTYTLHSGTETSTCIRQFYHLRQVVCYKTLTGSSYQTEIVYLEIRALWHKIIVFYCTQTQSRAYWKSLCRSYSLQFVG